MVNRNQNDWALTVTVCLQGLHGHPWGMTLQDKVVPGITGRIWAARAAEVTSARARLGVPPCWSLPVLAGSTTDKTDAWWTNTEPVRGVYGTSAKLI